MHNHRINNVLPARQARAHAFAAFKRDRKVSEPFTNEEFKYFDNEANWNPSEEDDDYDGPLIH